MSKGATTSIAHRLSWALIGLVTALWIGSTGLALTVIHHEIEQSLDSSLQEAAQRLLTLAAQSRVVSDGPAALPAEPVIGRLIVEHSEYLTYQLRDATGKVLLHSHDAPAEPLAAPLAPGFVNDQSFRIYTEGTTDGSLFVQIAEAHAHRHEAIVESGLALSLPLLLMVPLSAFAVRRIVAASMAPVLAIQKEISQRGAGNLAPLGSVAVASELQPITIAVDRLIGRLRAALEAERTFAANSAHELRTPLASVLAQVQRLRTTSSDASQVDRIAGIERELRRLVDLTEKLLQLSRAEAGVAMTLAQNEADLLPILEMVVEDVARGTSGADRVRLEPQTETLMSRMEIDAFGIVVRNLLENALLHGDPGQPVVVRVEAGGRLRFLNGGPVVPTDRLATLTRRFTRGATQARGAGLGLAIAETILDQSGGRLELRSPASGRSDGFEAIVDLG